MRELGRRDGGETRAGASFKTEQRGRSAPASRRETGTKALDVWFPEDRRRRHGKVASDHIVTGIVGLCSRRLIRRTP